MCFATDLASRFLGAIEAMEPMEPVSICTWGSYFHGTGISSGDLPGRQAEESSQVETSAVNESSPRGQLQAKRSPVSFEPSRVVSVGKVWAFHFWSLARMSARTYLDPSFRGDLTKPCQGGSSDFQALQSFEVFIWAALNQLTDSGGGGKTRRHKLEGSLPGGLQVSFRMD